MLFSLFANMVYFSYDIRNKTDISSYRTKKMCILKIYKFWNHDKYESLIKSYIEFIKRLL